MKKSRFTEAQIVSALKMQEAGISTREICRELGVTVYKPVGGGRKQGS